VSSKNETNPQLAQIDRLLDCPAITMRRPYTMVRSRFVLCPLLALTLASSTSRTKAAGFFSRLLNVDKDDDGPKITKVRQPSSSGTVELFDDHGVLLARLANNHSIPLVGIGVGNSPHAFVGTLVAEAIQDSKKTRLIDTSSKGDNEELVVQGIMHGIELMKNDIEKNKIQIHVVSKVWYTHLGYSRTKLAVEKTIANFKDVIDSKDVDFKLHLLLHWPRCDDSVSWMDCDMEELALPEHIRSAGPNPATDPDNAWKESWQVLEDMYLSDLYPIASIGVSNCHLQDLTDMHTFARIPPLIIQVNLWSLLYDARLVDYCHQQNIHVQVFNTLYGTLIKPEVAPRAFHHVQKIAYEISDHVQAEVTPSQVLLTWLIQHGVSVIPRTSKLLRLEGNSAVALSRLPVLTDMQVETIAHAVEAYLSGDDLEQDIHVSVSFYAVEHDLMVYWINQNGVEVRLAYVKQGEIFNETTYPNHVFRTYDASNRDIPYKEHRIHANFGGEEILTV